MVMGWAMKPGPAPIRGVSTRRVPCPARLESDEHIADGVRLLGQRPNRKQRRALARLEGKEKGSGSSSR